ncbi:hypothetical protein, partial [Labrys okinawensis]|uniref:hypothetical protein n=1 Tax=Labrys okinawensis TaxID=346911 RepID=UPI001AECD340
GGALSNVVNESNQRDNIQILPKIGSISRQRKGSAYLCCFRNPTQKGLAQNFTDLMSDRDG